MLFLIQTLNLKKYIYLRRRVCRFDFLDFLVLRFPPFAAPDTILGIK
jgi:hypothetical protein